MIDIKQVKEQLKLSTVVSSYINLTYNKGLSWGLCPFHDEKTPSFAVNDETGKYLCYGCKKRGDVIDFISEKETLDLSEALEFIASEFHLQIDIKYSKDDLLRKEIKEIYAFITNTYNYILKDQLELVEYLKNRQYDTERNPFDLFYVSDSNLYEILLQKGFSKNAVLKTNLFIKSQRGMFFRHQNRLTFPLHNEIGIVIGFSSRSLETKPDERKYVNDLGFNRADFLYGLDKAKQYIKDQDEAILVEGFFDTIASHSIKRNNTVATMGTKITRSQIKKIMKYTKNITMFMDGDFAGRQAIEDVFYLTKDEDINLRVIVCDDKKDPENMIHEKRELEDVGYLDYIHYLSVCDNLSYDERLYKCASVVKSIDHIKRRLSLKKDLYTMFPSAHEDIDNYFKYKKKYKNQLEVEDKYLVGREWVHYLYLTDKWAKKILDKVLAILKVSLKIDEDLINFKSYNSDVGSLELKDKKRILTCFIKSFFDENLNKDNYLEKTLVENNMIQEVEEL